MNYSCASKRTDGHWDYTRNGRATGYCREYQPIPEDGGGIGPELAKQENEKMSAVKDKFHCGGHETEDEACECYKQYLLDTQLRLQTDEPTNARQQFKCRICGKWTACHAQVGAYQIYCLCPEHQTKEHVASLVEVGESWES